MKISGGGGRSLEVLMRNSTVAQGMCELSSEHFLRGVTTG